VAARQKGKIVSHCLESTCPIENALVGKERELFIMLSGAVAQRTQMIQNYKIR
jgi:hypothetical protein